MAQKSWVISYAPFDAPDKREIIEHISNRKKIAQIEEYLVVLYGDILYKEAPEVAYDPVDVKTGIMRKSGTETVLEKTPYVVRAELIETDF
jgi:hypothetical protein